ncbi:MAG: RNA polymerase sigma factor [Burkholderiaceae bacterium]
MTKLPQSETTPLSSVDLDRLRPTLHRYCARMVGSVLDGEDIVQEALLRALESAVPNRSIENPEGWLFRIAHNLALDFLRRRARLGATCSEVDTDSIVDPMNEQERREAAASRNAAGLQVPACVAAQRGHSFRRLGVLGRGGWRVS